MKKMLMKAFLVLLPVIFLSGCGAREFLSTLGFDTHDYEGEEIQKTYGADSAEADKLIEMLRTLTIDSPILTPFAGAKEAMETYRDSVLNYMLNTDYAKYTGNIELLDRIQQEYPRVQIAAAIPAEDFENTVYTYFGGKQKIKNATSTLFVYLEKVNAYITVAQPQENIVQYDIEKIEETQQTYRIYFRCSLNDLVSPSYKALIIKREDGSAYFRYLEEYAQ